MRSQRPLLLGSALAAFALAVLSVSFFTTNNASANPVGGLVSVAAAEEHTCALTNAGTVKCWGENGFGQLANGHTSRPGEASQLTPHDTVALSGAVVALVAGGQHTCALISGGAVECWGGTPSSWIHNGDEQVNDPAVVGLSGPAVSLAAGSNHTCAIIEGGTVECWGANYSGQLGSDLPNCGIYIPCDGVPLHVAGINSATAIAGGQSHTCAVVSTGHVKCWGSNRSGQLGNGAGTDSASPVDVLNLTDAVSVVAGSEHTCVLTQRGSVSCWGSGYGNTPAGVSGLQSGVAAVAAAQSHTCALMTTGGLKCWGDNGYGQLGDGRRCGNVCAAPVDVLGLQDGVVRVATGSFHTCVLKADGSAMCWGLNNGGQIGNGTYSVTAETNAPVAVVADQLKPPATPTPCAPEGCPTATPRPAPPQTGLDFSISVDVDGDGIPDCGTSAGQRTQCFLAQGATFFVVVTLNALPPHTPNYEGFDVFLSWAGVSSDHKSDVTWPDCGFPAVFERPPIIGYGCAVPIGNITSPYTGPIGQSRFVCNGPGSVTLVHGDGNTDLVVRVGDIHAEATSGGEQLVLNCGEPRAGDVDCSTAVNSVDAAMMLQNDAKLLDLLNCPQFADVNLDRSDNAIDAALTLQYTAGLVSGLPVFPQGP